MGSEDSLMVCREMKIVQEVRVFLFVTVLAICQQSRAEPQMQSRFIRSSDSGVYEFREDLLTATNDYRRSQGKDDLSQSDRLDDMAQNWADKLAKRRDCSWNIIRCHQVMLRIWPNAKAVPLSQARKLLGSGKNRLATIEIC